MVKANIKESKRIVEVGNFELEYLVNRFITIKLAVVIKAGYIVEECVKHYELLDYFAYLDRGC